MRLTGSGILSQTVPLCGCHSTASRSTACPSDPPIGPLTNRTSPHWPKSSTWDSNVTSAASKKQVAVELRTPWNYQLLAVVCPWKWRGLEGHVLASFWGRVPRQNPSSTMHRHDEPSEQTWKHVDWKQGGDLKSGSQQQRMGEYIWWSHLHQMLAGSKSLITYNPIGMDERLQLKKNTLTRAISFQKKTIPI